MAGNDDTLLDRIGLWMARRLRAQVSGYEPYTPSDPEILCRIMQPGDILLVEGNQYISKVIKYLTMSTWSHAAVFVGPVAGHAEPDGEPHVLVEVLLGEGCMTAPMSKYTTYNTRICRPVGLTDPDRDRVITFMVERIGTKYDLKNILDMARYFFPIPVPMRFRRRAIGFGSGDPTRAICSTMIAEAFQSVRYPILPKVVRAPHSGPQSRSRTRPHTRQARREIFHIRHHSLFAPRDFDLSPYFAVIKPTLVTGFNYKGITWHDGAGTSIADTTNSEAAGTESNASSA